MRGVYQRNIGAIVSLPLVKSFTLNRKMGAVPKLVTTLRPLHGIVIASPSQRARVWQAKPW